LALGFAHGGLAAGRHDGGLGLGFAFVVGVVEAVVAFIGPAGQLGDFGDEHVGFTGPIDAVPAAPLAVGGIDLGAAGWNEGEGGVSCFPVVDESLVAGEADADQVFFGPGHGRPAVGTEVAQVPVHEVVVEGFEPAVFLFFPDFGVELFGERAGGPEHQVAAVAIVERQGLAFVGQKDHLQLVFW